MKAIKLGTQPSKKSSGERNKILTFEQLEGLKATLPGKKIVHCHGVFDVLHFGHLAYFKSAKDMGDILVVTLTVDKFVNKGPGRPYFPETVRAGMVSALEAVDFVALSPYPTAVPCIKALKPNLYVKGPDYRNKASDVTGGILEEERAVNEAGGHLAFTDDVTHSSSTLINKFFSQWNENQQRIIQEVQEAGGLKTINEVLNRVADLKVTVVGEPIVDTYVYCQPESLSSKSPSISARFLYQEDYAGGSLAIANHLASFVKSIDLLITHGGEDYFKTLLEQRMDPKVQIQDVMMNSVPTPRKTRHIDINTSQRFFEVTHQRPDQWTQHSHVEFSKTLVELSNQSDITIVSDFGHGIFEGPALKNLMDLRGHLAINVQTNSSNFGFNLFTKHERYDFLSIDTREARLAYSDRYTSIVELTERIRQDIGKRSGLAVTLGADGSGYFPKGSTTMFMAPAFADKIIDATGAGDAFFGLASLLNRVDCPPVLIPFLGNVFAGLKTKIIGNKSAISKSQFLKAVTSILR